jgi:F420-dependent oxidoreductase-like protein
MLQLGTFVPQGWRLEMGHIEGAAAQWQALSRSARTLEELGFDSLWLYDHFHTVPKTKIQPTFECWTTMAALAQITERVRLGQLVTCSLYRNPAYLAKVASCIDVMSGGRVDVGLGAGWKDDEFDAYDYEFPGIRERLDRMADSAKILKAMFRDEKATVEGAHHRVRAAVNEPKPLQSAGPPIWIGTQGEKVGLRIVAELADGWNHNRDVDSFERKLGVLHQHCDRIGRDPADVRVSAERTCAIFDGETDKKRYIERYWPGADAGRVAEYLEKEAVTGTPEQVAETLARYRDGGAGLIIVWFQDLADVGSGDSMAERFMAEVAPRLR